MTNQNEEQTPVALDAIYQATEKFIEINSNLKLLDADTEQHFALQQIKKNDFVWGAATRNPQSLYDAFTNVAAVGLSLNPATAYAYLVPRDNAIVLDISYKGLIKIATDTGSVLWAKADLVYSNDSFEPQSIDKAPSHKFKPFSERGEFVGVYCVAKTVDGDYLTEIMTAEEINKIRSISKNANNSYSPWVNHFGQMAKKTVIKRASNTWPKTTRHHRLETATHILNEHEGIDFENQKPEPQQAQIVRLVDDEQLKVLRELITEKGRDESSMCNYYSVDKLEELPEEKFTEAKQLLEMAKNKNEETENKNETAENS